MSDNTAPQRPAMKTGAVKAAAVSFVGQLDQGETLTGTPTVVASPGTLTVAAPRVNTTALTLNGRQVAIGKAVQFTASGGTAGVEYTVTVTVETSNGQTLVADIIITREA